MSDDTTQHIHFFHPSTPNTSIKPGIGEIGTARRPRAQSFELHTLHSMGGSPVNNTLRKTRHSDTHLMPTEHTPLLRSEVGTPQVNSRQPRTVKTAPTVWAWLSSWFGQKQDSPEEASVNRVLYEHDSFRGREKHFKTLEMNIAIDPESDSQSGSDSEDEWMEYSPLKQRNFTFPETPLQPCTNPIPHSPGNVSGYATSSNVSHNLGGRMLDKLMYCMRCCKRERSHHHGHKKSWWKSVKALLCLPVYRNLLGAMSALYFTVTGVQYWGTKYLLISLHAPLLLVNVLFVLCAATGPVLGVFFGGYIIDVFGGYKGYKKRVSALKLVCTLGLIGCVCTLPITFLDNIYPVVLCLWLVLFFGGSSLPACAGILVSVVPRHHRPTSASLSLVVFNMCGYCLSLILSGLLMQVLMPYY
ncbi:MFS transporter [archaeon]|nr:MAG: MFS transporter [archaeon]